MSFNKTWKAQGLWNQMTCYIFFMRQVSLQPPEILLSVKKRVCSNVSEQSGSKCPPLNIEVEHEGLYLPCCRMCFFNIKYSFSRLNLNGRDCETFHKSNHIRTRRYSRLLQVSDVQKSEAQHLHPNLSGFQENRECRGSCTLQSHLTC